MKNSHIIALPTWLRLDESLESSAMPSNLNINDENVILMQRTAAGDNEALRQLIDKWQSPLINFFYRSIQSREEAEDLAQTVFIKLHRAAPRYKPTAKFSTFIFHIARRQLMNHYRSRQRKPLDFVDPIELHAETSNDNVNYLELEEAFSKALTTLPEKQQTAILLLKQQELSYAEIAAIMKTSVNAVKSWIFRGRQALKEKLHDFCPSTPS